MLAVVLAAVPAAAQAAVPAAALAAVPVAEEGVVPVAREVAAGDAVELLAVSEEKVQAAAAHMRVRALARRAFRQQRVQPL